MICIFYTYVSNAFGLVLDAANSASNADISASMPASLLLRLVLAAAISTINAVISASLAASASACLVLAVAISASNAGISASNERGVQFWRLEHREQR